MKMISVLTITQGGVMDDDEGGITSHLNRLIDFFAKQLPDPVRATEDLMKFAKANDRRNYNLIRFCLEDNSDYKKMHRSMVRADSTVNTEVS